MLVIIGILIAVSINGWNEDRKLKIEEQSILKDLKQEMEMNLTALSTVIEENEKSFKAASEMKALIRYENRVELNKIPDSTFSTMIGKMNKNYTYDPTNGILNSIISSGKINQLSNKDLKYLLSSLKDLIADATEDTAKIEAQRDELMRSSYNHAYIIKDNKIIGYDIKLLSRYPDFIWATNHLFINIRRSGLDEEKKLKATFEHIIGLIDKNINK